LPLLLALPAATQTQDCSDALTTTLSSEIEHPLLPACAAEVSTALANVVRNSTSEQSTSKLTLLHRLTLFIRDPALFEAGAELAANTAAEPVARVLGLEVAFTQMDPALGFEGTGAARPFQGALSETCEEVIFTGFDIEYWADKGMAVDGEARLRTLAAGIAANASEPLMVRRFARCVVLLLPDADPPSYEVPEWDMGPPG
jgi:hypothetical protein